MAFAKSGPLAKLRAGLEEWKQNGKTSQAIFGIDHFGTTLQALQLALELFDDVYITHTGGSCTFHPKFYLFRGSDAARLYYGSHNLTTGGTETNLEAGLCLNLDLPEDVLICDEAYAGWEALLPGQFAGTQKLTAALLGQLVSAGFVLDETQARTVTLLKPSRPENDEKRIVLPTRGHNPFARLQPKPASPRPVANRKPRARRGTSSPTVNQPVPQAATNTTTSETLVMQINPHHNGEVFLSKKAVEQNQPFFGFPFTGSTTPKKGSSNKPYPQRDPDPVINVVIYDTAGNQSFTKSNFALNTVFYEEKSEIRVTISPDIREKIDPFSIMVMRQSDTPGIDYDIEIYNPNSSKYQDFLAVCDQTMPSGGGQARKFGWL
ncbi:MAG: phospholipase D family protein [Candidatus Competibacteraceae bacterium]|nr:phospholipase D family protein [Candidatus Competibacteraceae bacterium]